MRAGSTSHATSPYASSPNGEVASAAAGALFAAYALELWDECDERLLREFDLAGRSGPSSWVGYPRPRHSHRRVARSTCVASFDDRRSGRQRDHKLACG